MRRRNSAPHPAATERGIENRGGSLGGFCFAGEGRRVYELVKSGRLSWSIGYTVPAGGRRRDGRITQLTEIDLAEISTVPVPANEGVRTLSIKAMQPIELVSFEVA
jgi:phage head maturation protease